MKERYPNFNFSLIIVTEKFYKMSHLQSFVRLGVRSVSRQMHLSKLSTPAVQSRSLVSLVSKSQFNPAIVTGPSQMSRTLATKCKLIVPINFLVVLIKVRTIHNLEKSLLNVHFAPEMHDITRVFFHLRTDMF